MASAMGVYSFYTRSSLFRPVSSSFLTLNVCRPSFPVTIVISSPYSYWRTCKMQGIVIT